MSLDEDRSATNDAKSEFRISKQEFLNQVFGDVGTFSKDYHCALRGKIILHGRIYATDRFLMFYSKIFRREKKILIHFGQIKSISFVAGVFRCIVVETSNTTYTFNSFWEPEKSYYYLNDAFEKFKSVIGKSVVKESQPVDIEDEEEDEPDISNGDEGGSAIFDTLHKKVRVVRDAVLPISIVDFLATFVEDSAPHSYQKYHELVNDREVDVNAWTECGNNEFQRELRFMKPVNLPGLGSTRGVKYQQFRRPGDFGFALSSSTRLEDVPSADCFSVDDVLIVCAEGPQQVSVNISFEVAFVKSTMMRSFIEGPTEREMKKWLEAFFQHLQSTILANKDVVRGRRTSTMDSTASMAALSVDICKSADLSDTESALHASRDKLRPTPAILPLSSVSSTAANNQVAPIGMEKDISTSKSNEVKQEFLQNFFGPDVGNLFKDYHCALVGTILIQGRIYATDKAVLFYSSIFGREKAVMIPLSQVKHISHPQGVLRSIVIETDAKTYSFRSFWEPEKSFSSLEKMWRKVQQQHQNQVSSTMDASAAPDRRRYSLIDACSDDASEGMDLLISSDSDQNTSLAKYAADHALREKVDTGGPLPISLADFVKLFIVDDAPFGYDRYYESTNNTASSITAWSEIKAGEWQREIRFITPSVFIAFGNSRGVKSQLRIDLGDNCIMLKCSTHLEDVSFSTYFTIEEVVVIHKFINNKSATNGGSNGSSDEESVMIHLSFEVQLLKGSFARPLLCSMAAPELRRWYESYVKYIRDVVTQRSRSAHGDESTPMKVTSANGSPRLKDANTASSAQKAFTLASKRLLNANNSTPQSRESLSPSSPVVQTATSGGGCVSAAVSALTGEDVATKELPTSAIGGTMPIPCKELVRNQSSSVPSTYATTPVPHVLSLLLLLSFLCVMLVIILLWYRQEVNALHDKIHRIEQLLEQLAKQQPLTRV